MKIKPVERVFKLNRLQLEKAVLDYCGATDGARMQFTVSTTSPRITEVIVIDVNLEE